MLGLAKKPRRSADESGEQPILTGKTLLVEHRARLRSIRAIVGVPDAHWRWLYQTAFTKFAEMVQRLPASEAHHHCEMGGLLRHALEVVELALKIRRGYVLPPDKEPEIVIAEQDAWTYAIATASLLHDVGKAMVDQRIVLRGRDGLPIGLWSPWVGPMTKVPGTHYRIEFRRGQAHRLHEAVSPLLVTHIVPADGLRWLGDHHDALAAWLGAIGGHALDCPVIADIVKEAHQGSVAQDLSGERRQLQSASAKPLAERLLAALRQLIDSGALPVNRRGAGAFLDDTSLWLVCERGLDAIRDALQGQADVPARNDRLVDELQQRGFATPTTEQRAVWHCEVRVGEGVDSWCQTLSLLRIPLDRLWPDPAAKPPCAAVWIREVEVVSERSADADPAVADASEPASAKATGPGEPFLPWLIDGLENGALVINSAKAQVHVVDEGLLLVSPAIFRVFADEEWREAQKRFLKRKLSAKTARGENIFHYAVDGDAGTKTIKGLLIRNPEAKLGLDLPSANGLLSPKSEAE
ncbi:MAG: DNA-binding domain-containing protein [Woeseia sp.]|nr:DNA-binding domain-containing protein [Woeseia sp.]NNL54552.1 DNA-binding domain-containing protein [Woeseia sp.]